MTTYTHISGSTRRLAVSAALLVSATVAALAIAAAAGGTGNRTESGGSYNWPVKPFDRQHPVRGSFGDPRTVFKARATLGGVLRGRGDFSLHRGVDISAPDGSPVYPVASGVVTFANGEWLKVDSGGGRAFEYWHIRPMVRVGARVDAYKTVLGQIHRGSGHVHLSEVENEHAVNPLAPGHLGPYRDETTPRVTSIQFRGSHTGPDLLPHLLRGKVLLVAGAEDDPEIDAPGAWRGLPVAPALVTWRVETWTHQVALGEQVAADFRGTLPKTSFWQVYARGTYQNMAVFGRHFSWGQRGSYVFKLSPTAFDTRRLHDGAYDLVVTATDIRGNSSSLSSRFMVANHRR